MNQMMNLIVLLQRSQRICYIIIMPKIILKIPKIFMKMKSILIKHFRLRSTLAYLSHQTVEYSSKCCLKQVTTLIFTIFINLFINNQIQLILILWQKVRQTRIFAIVRGGKQVKIYQKIGNFSENFCHTWDFFHAFLEIFF